jgi:hypothetical protein
MWQNLLAFLGFPAHHPTPRAVPPPSPPAEEDAAPAVLPFPGVARDRAERDEPAILPFPDYANPHQGPRADGPPVRLYRTDPD